MTSKKSLEKRVRDSKDILTEGERLKQELLESPAEHFETLTFGELRRGDRYICFPIPGDNEGHGGYKQEHYLFEKLPIQLLLTPTGNIDFFAQAYAENAQRVYDSEKSRMPDKMPVIKVR